MFVKRNEKIDKLLSLNDDCGDNDDDDFEYGLVILPEDTKIYRSSLRGIRNPACLSLEKDSIILSTSILREKIEKHIYTYTCIYMHNIRY